MSSVLLAALLAVGADEAPGRAAQAYMPKVEGRWLIVYAEEGGRRNNAWEQKVATVKDNTLSYERDGEKRSLKLTFGGHQTLKASLGGDGAEGKTRNGVYIASQDYLCISLGGPPGARKGGDGEAGEARGRSSGSFILILRRQRGR